MPIYICLDLKARSSSVLSCRTLRLATTLASIELEFLTSNNRMWSPTGQAYLGEFACLLRDLTRPQLLASLYSPGASSLKGQNVEHRKLVGDPPHCIVGRRILSQRRLWRSIDRGRSLSMTGRTTEEPVVGVPAQTSMPSGLPPGHRMPGL